MRASPATVIVPFHNEAQNIERVMGSLSMQRRPCDVILVDNGSSDGSAGRVGRWPQVRDGEWTLVSEPRVGKFFALRTGVREAIRRGAEHVGVIDADSFVGHAWTTALAAILDEAPDVGFVFGPLRYDGFDAMPVFRRAYRAYNATAEWLMARIVWFAPGSNGVFSAELFDRYLATGVVSTELDFRPSALALWEGRSARLNRTPVFTSPRRVIASDRHFDAWCFYHRDYYEGRDINAETKTDFSRHSAVADLAADRISDVFRRRAVRIVCRNLIPLALFDRRGVIRERIRETFGLTFRDRPSWERYRAVDTILGPAFGEFAAVLEADEGNGGLVGCVEETMWRFYRDAPDREDGFAPVTAAAVQD
jgi:glycosyltransferase involved in cell wall biosynthesis